MPQQRPLRGVFAARQGVFGGSPTRFLRLLRLFSDSRSHFYAFDKVQNGRALLRDEGFRPLRNGCKFQFAFFARPLAVLPALTYFERSAPLLPSGASATLPAGSTRQPPHFCAQSNFPPPFDELLFRLPTFPKRLFSVPERKFVLPAAFRFLLRGRQSADDEQRRKAGTVCLRSDFDDNPAFFRGFCIRLTIPL